MDNEQNVTQETMPETPAMTDEEMAALEEARAAAEAAKLAPFKQAAQQRQHSADVIAEHDDLLADMLYEMTMNEIGTEA